jgi:hypothetical protein
MRRLMFTVAVVLVSTTFKATADELPDSTVQGLALQYITWSCAKTSRLRFRQTGSGSSMR